MPRKWTAKKVSIPAVTTTTETMIAIRAPELRPLPDEDAGDVEGGGGEGGGGEVAVLLLTVHAPVQFGQDAVGVANICELYSITLVTLL